MHGRGTFPSRRAADMLRLVGRLLDEEERQAIPESAGHNRVTQVVRRVNITCDDQWVSVTWEAPTGVRGRSLDERELSGVSDLARYLRSGERQPASARREWEEALRTLGQIADTEGIRLRGVFENVGKFRVTGHALDGSLVIFRYTREELEVISSLRALLRSAGAEPARPPQPLWGSNGKSMVA
jgi:hypothetical protein